MTAVMIMMMPSIPSWAHRCIGKLNVPSELADTTRIPTSRFHVDLGQRLYGHWAYSQVCRRGGPTYSIVQGADWLLSVLSWFCIGVYVGQLGGVCSDLVLLDCCNASRAQHVSRGRILFLASEFQQASVIARVELLTRGDLVSGVRRVIDISTDLSR